MSKKHRKAAENFHQAETDTFSFLEEIDTAEYPFRNPALPLEERIDNLLAVMTPGERDCLFNPRGHYLARLDLCFTGQVEGYHGAALYSPANWYDWPGTPTTQFCQAIGLAATWEPELVRQAAELMYWDTAQQQWVLEAGTHCIMAGGSSADSALGLKALVQVTGSS